jgi:sugar phosphate isomerase/epimerase
MPLADSLSIQLYSGRFMASLEDQFKLLASLGYRNVEPFSGLFGDVAVLKGLMRTYGMAAPTAHVGLEMWRQDATGTARICKDLGIGVAFVPAPPQGERDKDPAGWRAFGKELGAIGAAAEAEGVRFGYHNHHFEYGKAPDGRSFLDLIFAEAPDLLWEADFAWTIRGGGDPLADIARHGKRLVACHVKDLAPPGTCVDEDGWADPGHGTMDWPAIVEAMRGVGPVTLVAEHDKPNDMARFARRARETVAHWG